MLLICFCVSAMSQELSDTLVVYFRVGKSGFDMHYRENGMRADEFVGRIRALRRLDIPYSISLITLGTASPEGSPHVNDRLSEERGRSVYHYIKEHASVPDSLIVSHSAQTDWGFLASAVERDPDMVCKDQVLEIIGNGGDSRMAQLRKLDGGRAYRYMYDKIFPDLRACRAVLDYSFGALVDEPCITDEEVDLPDDLFADLSVDTVLNVTIMEPVVPRVLRVKTNTAGLALGLANVAVEFELTPHLSVSLPVYYSGGYDYFKETVKFRGIVVQSELRCYPWLKGSAVRGFHVGAHLGVGWYNFALDGDYRIQDHKGTRPAWGGGIGLGYALGFRKHPRWGMEFTIGAGIYDVRYDLFYNEENGPYHRKGIHDTWVGIDNAAITFTYDFLLKK